MLRIRIFLAAILFCVATLASAATPEIIAHRGASYDAPENTIAAIRHAWKQQADAVEFDVYLSKDAQIVLMHDKTTLRTAGVDRERTMITPASPSRIENSTAATRYR